MYSELQPFITDYFEEHACLVYLIWVCYTWQPIDGFENPVGEINIYDSHILAEFIDTVDVDDIVDNLVSDFRSYTEDGSTAAENIFRSMVSINRIRQVRM